MTQGAGSLEFFAFYDANATSGAVAPCASGGLTLAPFTFGASGPTSTLAYPDTVGATISQTTGFTLFTHYINTTSSPIMTHVSLTLYTAVAGAVTQHAGAIFLDNTTMSVPPGTQKSTASYTLAQSVNILASTSEMAQAATNFTATAGSQTLFTTTEWNQPPTTVFATPLAIPTGTLITWSCTDNNVTGTTLAFGESIRTNVKCVSLSFFYPVSDVTNPVIGNTGGSL